MEETYVNPHPFLKSETSWYLLPLYFSQRFLFLTLLLYSSWHFFLFFSPSSLSCAWVNVQLNCWKKKERWSWWRRKGERERKTILIDTWGVNPLSMAHAGRKEPLKKHGSVTGKRWRQVDWRWGRDRDGRWGDKGSLFLRTAVVLEIAQGQTGRIYRIFYAFWVQVSPVGYVNIYK